VIKKIVECFAFSAQSFVGRSIHLWLKFCTCVGFVCEL
jgi:hypothetical protein